MDCTLVFFFILLGGPWFRNSKEFIKETLNDRVELICSPLSEPSVHRFEWLKDGMSIDNNSSMIVFETVDYDHEGVYTCTAYNMYNNSSKTFQLKVKSKAFFVTCKLEHLLCCHFFRSTYAIVASHWYNT